MSLPVDPRAVLLQKLKEKIESTVDDAWFFPSRGTVKGFMGTGQIVIVGWRPGQGAFAEEGANRLFYGQEYTSQLTWQEVALGGIRWQ